MTHMDKKKVLLADLSLILVAALWGGGFVAVKDALNNIGPYYLMAMRFSLAAILLGVVFFKKMKTIKKSDLKGGTIVGVFLFLAFAFQTVGLQYTTASKQSFLTAVYVVIVPFLYWGITKKAPGLYNIVSAFLCLFGVGLLTLDGGLSLGIGDSLTLVCAIFFAGHIVSVGHYAQKVDPIILTVLQFVVSAVISLGCAIFLDTPPATMGKEVIFPILYLAVFSTLICYVIQNVAQKYTYSTHAALIMSTEAVFGTILSVLILSDEVGAKLIIGCILIFIAIIISETELKFLRKKKSETLDR